MPQVKQRRIRRASVISPPTPGPTVVSMPAPAQTSDPVIDIEWVDFAPEVAKAILATQNGIGKLVKNQTNEYANYKFASIDQFYEEATPIIRKNGLSVMAHLYDTVPLGMDYLIFKFHGSIMHKSGKRYRIGMVAVPMPIQGPQTAGTAVSYAEKILMRALFKIVTGEQDADSLRKDKPQRGGDVHVLKTKARQPEAAQTRPEPIALFDLPNHVASARTYGELIALWKDQNLDRYAATDPRNHRWLVRLFALRKEVLKPKAAG